MNGRILLVEDDEFVLGLLGALLEGEGFAAVRAATGKAMMAELGKGGFDLVLPDEDGLVLLRQIRTRSDIPVVVLTSRTGVEDRIQALELGADDFITKPADHREIVLRISRLLKGGKPEGGAGAPLVLGDLRLDTDARVLVRTDGTQIPLTRSEFDLLSAFVKAPNRVLTRGVLLDAINRGDNPPFDRAIDVLVSRLRKKIEPCPGNPSHIVTVPGIGYRLALTPR